MARRACMADEPSPSEFLISKMEGMDDVTQVLIVTRTEEGEVRSELFDDNRWQGERVWPMNRARVSSLYPRWKAWTMLPRFSSLPAQRMARSDLSSLMTIDGKESVYGR